MDFILIGMSILDARISTIMSEHRCFQSLWLISSDMVGTDIMLYHVYEWKMSIYCS